MNEMNEQEKPHMSDIDKIKIEEVIRDYRENDGNSLTILQSVQESFGYLPFEVVEYLSEKIGIPLGKMYGIATFYAQFKFHKRGKYIIQICDGTACHVKGSMLLEEFITNELGIRPAETTTDKLFSLEKVSCFGCCAIAPVVFINKDVYGNLTPAKLRRILNKYRKMSIPMKKNRKVKKSNINKKSKKSKISKINKKSKKTKKSKKSKISKIIKKTKKK